MINVILYLFFKLLFSFENGTNIMVSSKMVRLIKNKPILDANEGLYSTVI